MIVNEVSTCHPVALNFMFEGFSENTNMEKAQRVCFECMQQRPYCIGVWKHAHAAKLFKLRTT